MVANPIISVIIPVYGVENYILSCLQSLNNQKYQNFEIILVNDCTRDNSIVLAQDYLLNTQLSYVIVNKKKNEGLSAARNTGLKYAEGEWVYFLDSDDELESNALESLICFALDGYACVVGNYKRVYPDHDEISQRYSHHKSYQGHNCILYAYSNGEIPVIACNKLIRRAFLIENDLYFKEGIINEDELWTLMVLSKVDSLVLTGKVTYRYNIRAGSIMSDNNISLAKSLVIIYNEITMYITQSNLYVLWPWRIRYFIRVCCRIFSLPISVFDKRKLYMQVQTNCPYRFAYILWSTYRFLKNEKNSILHS